MKTELFVVCGSERKHSRPHLQDHLWRTGNYEIDRQGHRVQRWDAVARNLQKKRSDPLSRADSDCQEAGWTAGPTPGKLQHLSKEIQDFGTKIWTIQSRREETSSWHKLHHNEREKLLAEHEEAQFGLASAQETFWDLNVPGDPAQRAKERNAEASRWIRFKAERNEARRRAAWIRLEREARVNLATREQDLLDDEARLARTFKRGPSTKVDSSRSVSSRLGPVNQANSKSVSTRGTASPAPPTIPKKPKRVGSEKRRRVEKAKTERDPIGAPKVLTTTGTCRHARDLIARAQAKIEADAQVESLPPTLESRAGTPEDWETDPQWDIIVTEDGPVREGSSLRVSSWSV